jgi:hypothetical protein
MLIIVLGTNSVNPSPLQGCIFTTARVKTTCAQTPTRPSQVRAARRSLKRESKVQLSDEIIFFDDVAGNEQVRRGSGRGGKRRAGF